MKMLWRRWSGCTGHDRVRQALWCNCGKDIPNPESEALKLQQAWALVGRRTYQARMVEGGDVAGRPKSAGLAQGDLWVAKAASTRLGSADQVAASTCSGSQGLQPTGAGDQPQAAGGAAVRPDEGAT